MKVTSAMASKMLKELTNEIKDLQRQESAKCLFTLSTEENMEDVRPDYDMEATRTALAKARKRQRSIKHALNVFNTTTTLADVGMTIDEVLVYLPQLNEELAVLDTLGSALPKERLRAFAGSGKNIIEYRYANYDVARAKMLHEERFRELSKIQNALDLVNNTQVFEIPDAD